MDRRRRSFTTIIPERNGVICSNDKTTADDFVFFFQYFIFSERLHTNTSLYYNQWRVCVYEKGGEKGGIVQQSLCH